MNGIAPISKEQQQNINRDGWKEDELGIEARMEEYLTFQRRWRYIRDAKPTAEEKAKG